MTISKWTGAAKSDRITVDPTWDEVEAAIRALDNRDLNDLYLTPDETDPESFMCVGGGDGRYLVTGATGNERFPTLTAPAKDEAGIESLVVGGQEGEYPANWIIEIDLALRAAKFYWENGQYDPDLKWIET